MTAQPKEEDPLDFILKGVTPNFSRRAYHLTDMFVSERYFKDIQKWGVYFEDKPTNSVLRLSLGEIDDT